MFKIIFVVVTLVTLSCAYDFKDSEFNQMIYEDIQGVGSESSSRLKRDTETTSTETDDCQRKWKKNIHCCNGDTINKAVFDKLLKAKVECYKEIWGPEEEPFYDPFTCDQPLEIKDQATCFVECISKKMGLLDDEGNVKRDALVEHIKLTFKDTEWKVKATEDIVDKCLATFVKTKDDDKKCNRSAMHMGHCTWKSFIQQCPLELHSDKLKCKKIREKIEKGDEDYLSRVHLLKLIRHHEHAMDMKDTDKKTTETV